MISPSSSSSTLAPINRSPSAMVVMRSDSLTRSSSSPRKTLRPFAMAAAMKAIGNSSTMLGTCAGSGSTPVRVEAVTMRSPTASPPASLALVISIFPPISRSSSIKPARGIEAHIFDDDVRSRYEQCRNHREGGGGRIAGHDNILRFQLGLALYGYDPRTIRLDVDIQLRAESRQHPLAMVARRHRFQIGRA